MSSERNYVMRRPYIFYFFPDFPATIKLSTISTGKTFVILAWERIMNTTLPQVHYRLDISVLQHGIKVGNKTFNGKTRNGTGNMTSLFPFTRYSFVAREIVEDNTRGPDSNIVFSTTLEAGKFSFRQYVALLGGR